MADRMFLLATLWAVLINAGRTAEIETDPNVKDLMEAKSSLTTCCNKTHLYSVGFDGEKRWDYCSWSWTKITEAPFPPIYSSVDNKIIRGVHQNSTTGSLRPCPSGQVAKSSTEFRIYDDGSLKTAEGFEVADGDFCLNRIHSSAKTNEDGELSAVFAARFCVVDDWSLRCAAGRCVHKCCPMGMAVGGGNFRHSCQGHSKPFSVPFHYRNGSKAEADPSVRIRDGIPFDCEGEPLLVNLDSQFYILPDGTMHIPTADMGISDKFNVSKYCVDGIIDPYVTNMTKFGALVCLSDRPRVPRPFDDILDDIYYEIFPYMALVFSFFLVATFVVYALLPQLRNTYGVSIMCQTASMSVMYISMAIMQLPLYYAMSCVALAIVAHFAFLATFSWLNVQSFDIWWTFKNMAGTYSDHRRTRSDHKLGKEFVYYSLYAWGVPLLIVGFGQLMDNVNVKELLPNWEIIRPGFEIAFGCSFHTHESALTYLHGPLAVLILINTLFFVLTTISLCRSSFDARSRRDSANFHFTKRKFCAICILFFLMGLTWITQIFATFSVDEVPPSLWIPMEILNFLTAVFIFVIFVCNPKVWKLLVEKYPGLRRFDRLCPSCMRYNVEAAEQGYGQGDSNSDLQQTTI